MAMMIAFRSSGGKDKARPDWSATFKLAINQAITG
jgi:hypothetical protein